MSRVTMISELRQFERSLVKGYFLTNYNEYECVPIDIIFICIFYCFILDEFNDAIPVNSKEINIEGLNNTIANCHVLDGNGSHIQYTKPIAVGRKLIKPNTGKYHWKLKILNINPVAKDDDIGIRIGWINQENAVFSIRKMRHYLTIPGDCERKGGLLDLYFESDKMEICIRYNSSNSNITDSANDKMNYHLAVQFNNTSAMVEILEYNQSNWFRYSPEIKNKNDLNQNGLIQIGLASCEPALLTKLVYYRKALRCNSSVELWNDLYLLDLNAIRQLEEGYDHAIKYKKGTNGISELAESFIARRQTGKALKLFSLLNDKQLLLTNSNLKYGYCLKQNGEHEKAAKYMEIHLYELEHNKNNENYENEQYIVRTLRYLGWAYYDALHFMNALNIFRRLPHSEIVQYDIEGAIAHCYEHCDDFSESIKYYQLYQTKFPDNVWSYHRMAGLYDKTNDVGKQKQCLLKYIELSTDNLLKCHAFRSFAQFLHDKEGNYIEAENFYFKAHDLANSNAQKRTICCRISINYHMLEQWRDAIEYGLKALEYAPDCARLTSNLAEYYFHAKQLKNSYIYFKKAMKLDPLSPLTNGYFAMILFEWNRYDEAILYFEKYFEFRHTVSDRNYNNGMKSKCSNVFANILYGKENYEMSLEICQQAINDNDFNFYKKQDEIYYLLSRNYAKLMDFQNALQYVRKANSINPNRKLYDNQIRILMNTLHPVNVAQF